MFLNAVSNMKFICNEYKMFIEPIHIIAILKEKFVGVVLVLI